MDLVPVRSVSAGDGCRLLGKIPRADFDSDGNSLFDPLPILHTAAEITRIDLDD